MREWIEIFKGRYLMRLIMKTEKKLCKHVSKFTGINVVAVERYREEGAVKDE